MIRPVPRAAARFAGVAWVALALSLPMQPLLTASAWAQQAQDEYMIDVEGWRGGPFALDETGTYGGCRVHRFFGDGIAMVVGTNPEFQTEIAILNENWALEPGTESAARLSVDGNIVRERPAVAAGQRALVIPIGNDEELYEALRRGNVLTAQTAEGEFRFPLSGTARSLSALRECVEQTNELIASNPQAAQPEEERRRAMPIDGLVSLLVEAGLEDLGLMLPEAVPDNALNLRFVWRTGSDEAPVIGGLHQAPRGEEVAIDEFAEAYLGTLEAICPEGFSAELDESELIGANYALKTGQANCATAQQGEDFVSLIFALDSFNYSVFYHTTAADNSEMAEQATRGLEEVLREVAVRFAEAEEEQADRPGDGEASETAAEDADGPAAPDDAAPDDAAPGAEGADREAPESAAEGAETGGEDAEANEEPEAVPGPSEPDDPPAGDADADDADAVDGN